MNFNSLLTVVTIGHVSVTPYFNYRHVNNMYISISLWCLTFISVNYWCLELYQ